MIQNKETLSNCTMRNRKLLLFTLFSIICLCFVLQFFSLLVGVVYVERTNANTHNQLRNSSTITTNDTVISDQLRISNNSSSFPISVQTANDTHTSNGLQSAPNLTMMVVLGPMLQEALQREYRKKCFFPHEYYLQYQKSIHDRHRGSCTPEHTWYNEHSHSIFMKCVDRAHVPYIYHSNVHNDIVSDLRHWRPYPVEAYVKGERMKLPQNLSMIHTACIDLSTRSSYHSFRTRVWRNEELVRESKPKWQHNNQSEQLSKPIDIRIIVLDCVGRSLFHRHFPHTKQYLRELTQISNSDFSVLELENYQVLGFNSIVNMYQFSTDYHATEKL